MNPGDWIRRKGVRLTPFHHGIYIGSNRVVHASSDNMKVEIASLESFAKGREVYVVRSAPLHKEWAIVQRSLSLVGKRFSVSGFNCEHLASLAFNGEERSRSIRTATGVVIASTIGLLLLARK